MAEWISFFTRSRPFRVLPEASLANASALAATFRERCSVAAARARTARSVSTMTPSTVSGGVAGRGPGDGAVVVKPHEGHALRPGGSATPQFAQYTGHLCFVPCSATYRPRTKAARPRIPVA